MEINEALLAEISAFRKELHQIPETSGEEFKTCEVIRRELAKIPGVRVLPPFLQTDTVAFIDGCAPGKNVTLRADIDALAVPEETGVDFASKTPGKMHACGHDVHCAILLGAAKILAAKRHEFKGSIRLVFQPGEEGTAMARDLIAAGALEGIRPDFVAALHVEPGLPVGTVGVREGCMASSCLHYKVTFTGKGGHGSMPHLSKNPILAAAAAVSELQYVVTNRIDVQKPAVMSICNILGGAMDNVIPESCEFGGTLRSLDNETAKELYQALQEICQGVAQIHRCQCEITISGDYPAVINPASGVNVALKAAAKAGLEVRMLESSAMSSEDFACFLMDAPDGVFVRLGAGENLPPLHNVKFLPPEEIFKPGIEYMVSAALTVLE
ncbi:MAG: amidohydrolase [Lentisphaerae bacterium]|nr:amidohydrolase [Lentisphaerota bacterium]